MRSRSPWLPAARLPGCVQQTGRTRSKRWPSPRAYSGHATSRATSVVFFVAINSLALRTSGRRFRGRSTRPAGLSQLARRIGKLVSSSLDPVGLVFINPRVAASANRTLSARPTASDIILLAWPGDCNARRDGISHGNHRHTSFGRTGRSRSNDVSRRVPRRRGQGGIPLHGLRGLPCQRSHRRNRSSRRTSLKGFRHRSSNDPRENQDGESRRADPERDRVELINGYLVMAQHDPHSMADLLTRWRSGRRGRRCRVPP